VSRFNGARAHIFVRTSASTCVLPTWGESQLGFWVLANRPLRDANRLPWLAPCIPAIKATVVEHRLSQHWDSQWMNWTQQWLVRQFQVGSWHRVGLCLQKGKITGSSETFIAQITSYYYVVQFNNHTLKHAPPRPQERKNHSALLHKYCTIIQERNT
jgi:hypothetical protein